MTHGSGRRKYLEPDQDHEAIALSIPEPESSSDLDLPESALGFTYQLYGNHKWRDVFTHRQLQALSVFSEVVAQVPTWITEDGGDDETAKAVTTFLALCVGKLSQFSSSPCLWKIDSRNGSGKAESAKFGRNDLTMTWDFVETNPFGGSVGDWNQIVVTALRGLSYVDPVGPPSRVLQGDARTATADLHHRCLIVTDPPYFSAIGYANLSDYFYLWIRRSLRDLYPGLFATLATPKAGELIAEPARHASRDDAKAYFIDGFTEVFGSIQDASREDLPIVFVYAYKEQEAEQDSQVSAGWEAMLEAVIRSGLGIVGTWPIHGTGSTRMRGLKSNALATYVALVCRPRGDSAPRISRRDFAALLRDELGPAVRILQQTAVAPVDLAQAVIGPGMAVFTRFSAVLEPEGSPMTVRSALLMINTELSEVLNEQESDFDPDTRWAVAWFELYQFQEAPSGVADQLARAKGTSVDGLERAGLIVTRGGTCRLIRRDELAEAYDPLSDIRSTIWEATQYLVKLVIEFGEEEAARLFSRLPNVYAVRDLAYRLYALCEKKGWAEEAGTYNVLVASWPEVSRLSVQVRRLEHDRSGQLPGI